MTPLMYCPNPFVVNSMSRYARRFSSTLSTLMLLKRRSIVPVLSSAARMPLHEATMAFAIAARSLDGIAGLLRDMLGGGVLEAAGYVSILRKGGLGGKP